MECNLTFRIVSAIIVLLLNIFVVLAHDTEIVYNLAKIGSVNEKISTVCRTDLERVLNSIHSREIWAMKLLDASGKFGSGFVWGNNYLLGDKSGCRIINKPIHITQTRHLNPLNLPNLLTERSPFPVEYRVVYIRHSSQLQFDLVIYDRKILHLGLCFPQSCRDSDTVELAQTYFYKHDYVGHQLVGNNIQVLSTKTLDLRPNFWKDKFVKLLMWITIFNGLNIVIGTIYTYNVHRNRIKLSKKTDEPGPVKSSLIDRWFACFSLIENTKSIFSLNIRDDSIKIVHGIRAVGMCWLIMGHVIYYGAKATDNIEINMKYSDLWYFQPITTDFLGVDTFTVLAGFLLSFLYFERLKTTKEPTGVHMVVKSIFFRYMRLTPLYFVVILLTYTLTIYLADTTPFAMLEDYETNCNERWWLNMLYINNLIPLKDICLNWSWFVANDFQCFVIAVIVLVVFTRNNKLGIWLGTGISLVAMAICMHFAVKQKFSFALDNYFNSGELIYFPTWNRVAAYFVSIFAGWYFSMKNRQLRLSKFYIVLYWVVAETILFGIVFLHVYKEYNPMLAILYCGFGRVLWSIATCWIIIACESNKGGFLAKILQMKIWIPLSRMSFACYLLNPITITSIIMLSENAYHINLILYIIESVGFIVICFLTSYIMMVIYENPFNMLIRTFIEKTK